MHQIPTIILDMPIPLLPRLCGRLGLPLGNESMRLPKGSPRQAWAVLLSRKLLNPKFSRLAAFFLKKR